MSEENETPEVEQNEEGDYYDHSIDNSVHHAVNLWPLVIITAWLGAVFLAWIFFPTPAQRQNLIRFGKSYEAVGNIVDCPPPVYNGFSPNGGTLSHSFIRTPKDEFFSVYWRRDFQPPNFGAGIGKIKYHECGTQDGVVVYCFDSFAMSSERAKVLDLSPRK